MPFIENARVIMFKWSENFSSLYLCIFHLQKQYCRESSSKFFRSNLNEDGQRLLKLKGVEAVSQSLLLLLPIRLRSLRIRFGICCALHSTRLPFMSPSLLISLPLNTCKGGCVLLLLSSSVDFGAALNSSFRNCSRSFWPITIGS